MPDGCFGLIGRTLSHSFSPAIYRELGIPDYRLIPLEPEAVGGFLNAGGFGGLNVTIPYKQAVIPFCAHLSEEARAIGSVNVLVPGPQGLWGHNTDAYGFAYMARRAGIDFSGAKVLVFGSGGAALTARYVARQGGAARVVTVSRTGGDHYGNLYRHRDAHLLINATPVGMYPKGGRLVADLTAFPRCRGVLDLVYNPLRTAWLLQAQALGIPHGGGLPMLVAQAGAAARLFTGRPVGEAEIERVLLGLRRDKENMVLIGMPGSGKSTVGRALARLTGRVLVDLDEEIVRAAGLPIPILFDTQGEAAFRQLESKLARALGSRTGIILATGGGVVLDAANRSALRQNGRLYHIIRDTALLARAGRPLSLHADLEAMHRQRLPLYTAFRDAAVDNNSTIQETAAAIWEDFCAYSSD